MLQQFKKKRCYFGIVTDEFGAFEGVLTLHDISEALVGDLPDSGDELSEIVRREDGSLLVSGSTLASQLNQFLDDDFIPVNNPYYRTIAGFVLHELEHLPKVGEHFEYEGRKFEVMDMDGAKIDKLLLTLNDNDRASG